MKSRSPREINSNLIHFKSLDNCDCNYYIQEDCNNSNINGMRHQNIHSKNSIVPCLSHSPSLNQVNMPSYQNCRTICICEKICNCPCHCVACICCPCVKEVSRVNTNIDDYYKTLYFQAKSELENEKKRNNKIKCEKKNLLLEIEQLKNKLSEAKNKLEQEEEKNNKRNEELRNFD